MTRAWGIKDWNDMRVFAAVARAGSIRQASHELGASPQKVSWRINKLETELGGKLVTRRSHGIELTNLGERFLNFALAAETQIGRAAAIVHDDNGDIEGECNLALGDGMGTYWFPRFAALFGKLYPRIALHAYTSTERTTVKGPSNDIQVQYSDSLDPNLVAIHVATLHFMLFASRKYLAEYGMPRTPEDLANHRLIDFTLAKSDRGTFASFRGVPDRTVIIANAIATQCEAIRWDAGIGLLPSYAGLVHANLVPAATTLHMPMPVYLCYEREAAKRSALRATLEFLQKVVFDPARMPWFADKFILPNDTWDGIAQDCATRLPASLESASLPARKLRHVRKR